MTACGDGDITRLGDTRRPVCGISGGLVCG
jgi:hypothetical protein